MIFLLIFWLELTLNLESNDSATIKWLEYHEPIDCFLKKSHLVQWRTIYTQLTDIECHIEVWQFRMLLKMKDGDVLLEKIVVHDWVVVEIVIYGGWTVNRKINFVYEINGGNMTVRLYDYFWVENLMVEFTIIVWETVKQVSWPIMKRHEESWLKRKKEYGVKLCWFICIIHFNLSNIKVRLFANHNNKFRHIPYIILVRWRAVIMDNFGIKL